jgi:hypothetical protein
MALDRAQDSASKRSWKNFLSACNDSHWKHLRKHAMVWSLNRLESQLFLAERAFRDQLLLKMEDASHQLQLIVTSLPVNEKGVASIEDIKVHSLRLLDNLSLTGLSSSSFVQSLILDYIPNLTSLGDYERLRTLKLNEDCENLVSVGQMKCLAELMLVGSSEPMLHAVPLESLEKLTLQRISNLGAVIVSLVSRLQSLQELTISGENSASEDLPLIQLNSLRSLTVQNIPSLDLTGFPNLTSFTIISGVFDIFGKDTAYPRLISFDGPFKDSEDFRQMHQLKKLRLHSYKRTQIKTFHIPDKVTSIDMYSNVVQFTSDSQNRRFDDVKLFNCDITDLSLFRYVTKMVLNTCIKLEDIEPLKNVQYLELTHCNNITNFSCLGSQQMLFLQGCSSLTNSDVEKFANIRTLILHSCLGVTRLAEMNNNNLVLYNCTRLEEINLSGSDFFLVKLFSCQYLKSLNITGQVEELSVKDCPSVDMNQVANYKYFSSNVDYRFLFSL